MDSMALQAQKLMEAAAEVFGIPITKLFRGRREKTVDARRAMIYVMTSRKYLGWKVKPTANRFGKHHATWLWSNKRHDALMDTDATYREKFEEYRSHPKVVELLKTRGIAA